MTNIGTLIVYETCDYFVNNTDVDVAFERLKASPRMLCALAETVRELIPVHVILDEDQRGEIVYCEFQFRMADAATIAERLGSDEMLALSRASASEAVSPSISPRIKGSDAGRSLSGRRRLLCTPAD